MTTPTQANPSLGAFTAGYDPVAHTTGVALRVANIQTDTSVTPNVTYGDLGVDVTVSISPTANQRVNAQSGDFVAGSVVDLATLLTLSGTPTDANTVNSLMGRLTKVRDLLSAFGLDNTDRQKVSLYGKNAAAGDTLLSVDSGGRANVVQTIGGTAISATNPEPNISNIQQLILNGQGFSATTGKVSAAANMAAQFWVPNTSTKNVLIWSVRTSYSNANQSEQFQYITAQDATLTGAGSTNDSANFLNLKAGGAAAASGATLIHNGGIGTATGTPLDFADTSLSTAVELLSPGMFILIPAGTAAGIAVYSVTTAAGFWSFTVRFCEY